MKEESWMTCWSRPQRGMGLVTHLFQPFQNIHIQLPEAKQVRFHFSSWYEEHALTLSDITCTWNDKVYPITIQGAQSYTLQAQCDECSDAILFPQPITSCTLSFRIHSHHSVCSAIQLMPYDHVQTKHHLVYLFSGIDVIQDVYAGCINVLGDSICEMGMWTTPLETWCKLHHYLFINDGISGNRLCHKLNEVIYDETLQRTLKNIGSTKFPTQGASISIPLGKQCFGKAGYQRFEQEILPYRCGAKLQIFALGTNDLYQPGTFCSPPHEFIDKESFLHTYRILCKKAKAKGWLTIGLALPPFGKAEAIDEKKLNLRREINDALAIEPLLDGFVTFDECLSSQPDVMDDDCHIGDYLHPNEEGGKRMASSIIKEVAKWLG